MPATPSERLRVLSSSDPEHLARVLGALRSRGIPHQVGIMPGDPPRAIVTVAEDTDLPPELPLEADETEDVEDERDGQLAPSERAAARFAWWHVEAIVGVVLAHLALVLWAGASAARMRSVLELLALRVGDLAAQPWRLLSSLAVHVDPPHVLWNGAAMLAFGVALLGQVGALRTAVVYTLAGVGGGLAAAAGSEPGTLVAGSSGAVCGLFGAWLAVVLRQSSLERSARHARLRALGIALLVLPPILNPATPLGQAVSIESHLGGTMTGLIVGLLLGGRIGDSPG